MQQMLLISGLTEEVGEAIKQEALRQQAHKAAMAIRSLPVGFPKRKPTATRIPVRTWMEASTSSKED